MRNVVLLLLLPLLSFGQVDFVKITDTMNVLAQQTPIPIYNGVSWIDYDGDGWEDCFISSNNLYRNLQNGNFEKVFFSGPNFGFGNGNSWADYDGDGDLDVIIAASPTRLYRNDVDSFALVDFTIPPIDTFNFWSATWGDYDEDGWVDLALMHPAGFLPSPQQAVSRSSLLLKNNQDGTFSRAMSELDDEFAAYTIGTWTDYDLDGDIDLFVGSGEVSFLSLDHLFTNQLTETGQASIERIETGPLAEDLRDGQNWNFIDYDLDGDLDAFVTNYNTGKANDLYRNDNGTYTLQTLSDAGTIAEQFGAGLGNLWADFNNDGYQDCFVTFDGTFDRYYHNNGDGTFTASEQPFTISANSRGAATGDYDNDGFMDIMVSATIQDAVGLYHNEGNDNKWIHLRLEGNTPNTAAIGAQVRLKANLDGASKWQYREVNAQNNFNGQNSHRLHFGLDQTFIIDSIEVTWPDGSKQYAANVDPNQICDWQQGSPIGCTISNIAETAGQSAFINVFPNPNTVGKDIKVSFQFNKAGETSWNIYDSVGKLVLSEQNTIPDSLSGETTLPTNALSPGWYLLELTRGNIQLRQSFIIYN